MHVIGLSLCIMKTLINWKSLHCLNVIENSHEIFISCMTNTRKMSCSCACNAMFLFFYFVRFIIIFWDKGRQ